MVVAQISSILPIANSYMTETDVDIEKQCPTVEELCTDITSLSQLGSFIHTKLSRKLEGGGGGPRPYADALSEVPFEHQHL